MHVLHTYIAEAAAEAPLAEAVTQSAAAELTTAEAATATQAPAGSLADLPMPAVMLTVCRRAVNEPAMQSLCRVSRIRHDVTMDLSLANQQWLRSGCVELCGPFPTF